jgi:peptidylprolyl isomerase
MVAQNAFVAPLPMAACTTQLLRRGVSTSKSHAICRRETVSRESGISRPCASAGSSNAPSLPLKIAGAVAAGILAFSPALELTIPHSGQALAAKGGGDTFSAASGGVNKDSESLLRWALPINNEPVRAVQSSLESAINDARGKNWGKVESDVRRAVGLLKKKSADILDGVPKERRADAQALLRDVEDSASALTSAVEERNLDKFVELDRDVLRNIGTVEEAMVTGFPYSIPKEYSNLPRLLGRATVEMTVRKENGESFDLDGTYYKEGQMVVVVDGYNAPLSAGAFVDLVSKGFYDNLPIIRSDGFIVQSGKPNDADGYVQADGQIRTVPLELFAKGDSQPLYGMTLEEDGRGAAATALPFSSYGTLAMARDESEPNTASSQYFWFLFEPDLTPAGRNLMDGSWAVFGYTVKGQEFLRGLQRGDLLVSAKVVSGLENLKADGA